MHIFPESPIPSLSPLLALSHMSSPYLVGLLSHSCIRIPCLACCPSALFSLLLAISLRLISPCWLPLIFHSLFVSQSTCHSSRLAVLRESSRALRNYRKRCRAQLRECQEKKVKEQEEEKASIASENLQLRRRIFLKLLSAAKAVTKLRLLSVWQVRLVG